MRTLIVAGLMAAAASAAHAGDPGPHYGPPPAWVKPAPPETRKAPLAGAPLQLLLVDTQAQLQPAGEDLYTGMKAKVLTPQGLALGNLSLVWDPQTETLTIHRLTILRGGQVIDVLASDKFTVLRREQNLEQAMLDGRLTANLQVKGLQVGDVLEFAMTKSHRDPLLAGHPQFVAVLPPGSLEGRARVRAAWPKDEKIAVRATPDLGKAPAAGAHEVAYDFDGLSPLTPIDHAPPRYLVRRVVQASGFASWGEISALMAPLYTSASTLAPDSPLKAEAAKIAAGTKDPVERMMKALALVQDQVRYVFVGLDSGAYRPAKADETWSRRFGDCKAKTVLLLALLRELGVEAEPVLADMGGGDGLDQRLPMLAFNHVLVHATIAGQSYWLDGTRSGDTELQALQTYPYGWALPVRPAGAGLEHHDKPPLSHPETEEIIQIDATAGLDAPAPITAQMVLRGDEAYVVERGLAALPPDQAEQMLKNAFHEENPWIDVSAVKWRYDRDHRLLVEDISASGKMDWSKDDNGRPLRWFEVDNGWFPRLDPFVRPKEQDQAAPYRVGYPSYSRVVTTVHLPKGMTFGVDGANVDEIIGGEAYVRRSRLQGDWMEMYRSVRAVKPEISPAEAAAADVRRDTFKPKGVWIRQSEKPADASAPKPPTTELAKLLQNLQAKALEQDPAGALAAIDQALQIKPDPELALKLKAFRPEVLYFLGRYSDAADDYSALIANSKAPKAEWEYRRIQMLRYAGKPDLAMQRANEAVAAHPKDASAYAERASVWEMKNDLPKALADADAAISAQPDSASGYRMRADILWRLNHRAEAVRAAEDALRVSADDPTYMTDLAVFYERMGRRDDAVALMDEAVRSDPLAANVISQSAEIDSRNGRYAEAITRLDQALAIHPNDALLLNARCWTRALSGKELGVAVADCERAISLRKDFVAALDSRAFVSFREGHYRDAITRYNAVLSAHPDFAGSLYGRGLAKLRSGDKAGGNADIAAAKAKFPGIEADFGEVKP